MIELTLLTKRGGALTKQISLDAEGRVISDGSACVMTHGTARRVMLGGIGDLPRVIADMQPNMALAFGVMRPDQPDVANIVTKGELNGHDRPGLIARTQDYLCYAEGEGAALLDYDTKGMPAEIRARIDALGGFFLALVSVIPQLANTARVLRASTSAGLFNKETGQQFPGSGGMHAVVLILDARDTDRFVRVLHERCWLAGLGWMMVGNAGQLLPRSIVDWSVGKPERLIFEGPPVLVPPLAQDAEARRPVAHEGSALDSLAHCPPLTIVEQGKLRELLAKEKVRLAPECGKAKRTFIARQTERLVARGIPREQAQRTVERQCEGILHPSVVLLFDDAALAGTTVGDVLADPAKFEGESLADPLEGIEYGSGKAKIMLRSDGEPWIHSFAHGRTDYHLRYDFATVKAALEAAAPEETARLFVRCVLTGDLSETEGEMLLNITSKRSGIGKRALNNDLKDARERLAAQQAQQKRDRQAAEVPAADDGVTLDDFYAYMPAHTYIYTPTRDPWPGPSVDGRIGGVVVGVDADGRPISIKASLWLDRNKPIEQATWAPGMPMIIKNRLILEGGWIEHENVSCLNLYRAPTIKPGDPARARHWLKLVRRVYPNDADHIIMWLAHRRKRPQEKINHALVLGGDPGIGKDTIIEPGKYAVGPWNFSEISPKKTVDDHFNGFMKAVIVRISEARDLGDTNRFDFYEHMKVYTAAPPDVLRLNEKYLKEYNIVNCAGIIITTNYKTGGIYLPENDRRHYVAWSGLVKEDFEKKYWTALWNWYANGGYEHVTAYLDTVDLSKFDAKAPPLKTEAFWEIVNAGRTPEDAELADVLDNLERPDTITKDDVIKRALPDFQDWLADRRNNTRIPHRFAQCGYVAVRNTAAKDGQWVIAGKRQTVYVREELPASRRFVLAGERAAGEPRQDVPVTEFDFGR